jgi:hypothetical protein
MRLLPLTLGREVRTGDRLVHVTLDARGGRAIISGITRARVYGTSNFQPVKL